VAIVCQCLTNHTLSLATSDYMSWYLKMMSSMHEMIQSRYLASYLSSLRYTCPTRFQVAMLKIFGSMHDLPSKEDL